MKLYTLILIFALLSMVAMTTSGGSDNSNNKCNGDTSSPTDNGNGGPGNGGNNSDSGSDSLSSGGGGSAGGTFSGDGTFYSVGLGACGKTNSDSELVAAASVIGYDPANCFRSVKIVCDDPKCLSSDASVTVTIVDKCMGCDQYSLDLSPTAFSKLADQSVGRIKIKWSWA